MTSSLNLAGAAAVQANGRAAILQAARRAFALEPYATVTLRSIAAEAGVSPALIVKHFGGKEQLFDAVTDFSVGVAKLFDAPTQELGRHMVVTLLEARSVKNDPILRVVFAIGRVDERSVLMERFRTQVLDALTARIDGPNARMRSGLVIATLLGLSSLDSLYRGDLFPQSEIADITNRIAPALQALIDGP